MAAIDWNVGGSARSPGPDLASLGATLDLIAQRRQQWAKMEQERQMEAERIAAQQEQERLRAEAAKEAARLKAKEEIEKRRFEAQPKIREALETGKPEAAVETAQMLGGELRGIQWQAPPPPPEPEMPGAPQPGRMAEAAALTRVSPEVYAEVRGAEASYQKSLADREAKIAADKKRAEERTYELLYPGAAPIFMSEMADVKARLAAGGRELAGMEKYAGIVAEMDKQYDGAGSRAMALVQARVKAGQVGTDKESIDQVFRQELQNERAAFARAESAMAAQAGLGIRRAEAARKPEEKEGKVLAEAESKFETATRGVFNQAGFKDLQKVSHSIRETLDLIDKGGAGAKPIVLGRFVRLGQGPGVLSDKDMPVFWNRIGGVITRTWDAVQDALRGNMGRDKQALVTQALIELARSTKRRYAEVEGMMTERFSTDYWNSVGGNWKTQAIRLINPKYKPKGEGDLGARMKEADL